MYIVIFYKKDIMTVKELKTWVANLPEAVDDFTITIRDLKEIDEKIYNRDVPIGSIAADEKTKQMNFFDMPSAAIIGKIRAQAQESKSE